MLLVHGGRADAQPEPEQPVGEPEPEPPPPPVHPSKPQPVLTPPTQPAPAPTPVSKPLELRYERRGLQFGSYGRVLAGSDLRGGKPEPATVVAHGPRIVEDSYLELDFSYLTYAPGDRLIRPVVTLAFDSTLFHETGNFDAQPALRNLFVEADVRSHVTAWVGSRMYRGDDIYLFDYWPLDDQNTVGGGARYRNQGLEVAGHVGWNRLEDPSAFQFQAIDVADPEQGARTIVQLNRQRMVASTTASWRTLRDMSEANWKVKFHGEVHGLGAGERERPNDGGLERLPGDFGYLIGAQLGTYGYARTPTLRRFANVFVRYACGLAAFDELAPPTSFDADLKATRASELTIGTSANWDHARANVNVGGLARRFVDADRNSVDVDDGWEYALAARGLANLGHGAFAGTELSYQARFPRGLNPISQRAADPAVFQIAPMLVFSPLGPSSYDRPQLRLVYRAAHANRGARDLFVPDDPRAAYTWTHFLGVQAEWWINSASLIR